MWSVKKGRVGERKEKTGGLGVGKGVVVGEAQQVGGYACCVFVWKDAWKPASRH